MSHFFQRLYLISVSCFIAFGLMALYLNRKPYCIDSNSVEKIDIYSKGESKKSIYKCASDIEVSPSTFVIKQLAEVQMRISAGEQFLRLLGHQPAKLQISILKEKPLFFVLEKNHLWIGEKLFFSRGHLERALFKNWMRGQWATTFVHSDLVEDVLSDLFYIAAFGKMDLEDPVTKRQIQYESAKWPQVLQSVQGYCGSPWRASEHYEFCSEIKSSQSVMSSEVLERSLRPLLTESMQKSLYHLKLADRLEFMKNVGLIFQQRHTSDLALFKNFLFQFNHEQNQMRTVMTLVEASEYLKNINLFFSSSELTKKSPAYRQFIAGMGQQILAHGFSETFSELNFDIVFVSENRVEPNSVILAQFQNLQKRNPSLRMAVKDKENIWILPSRYSLPLESFGKIRAERAIVEQCTSFSFSNVLEQAEEFQRVLMVGTCQPSKTRNYLGYIKEGAKGFARMNPDVSFVQVHVPSALMKKDELISVQNIFEFLKNRESMNPLFLTLGWQEIKWNQALNVYSPKAFIDAIELFRDSQTMPQPTKQN
ncbi:MAG: hypothetical protein ACK5WZ_00810 [Pseudobdellovibrionaceae bacterium]